MFKRIKEIFTIKSIKRRIQLAFASIILLLFFSGATSLLELERVSHDTEEILLASKENVDLASEMISALNEQNDAMIQMAVIGGALKDIAPKLAPCEESMKRLSEASERAQKRMQDTESASITDSLAVYTKRINELATTYINGDVHRAIASDSAFRMTTHSWYVNSYKPQYVTVSTQITRYMTGSESTLGPDVNRLSHTARRAVTPVFLALVVMTVVILMFYYFIHWSSDVCSSDLSSLIRPVLRINDELGDYLRYRTHFDRNIVCRDEIQTLRDRILALIQKQR